jgi:hypothetical protein
MPTAHAVGSIVAPLARLFLIASLVALTLTRATAQDPFAPPMPGADPAAAPPEDPFGAGAAPGAAAKPKADEKPSILQREPLVIQQLRDTNPTTPDGILRAAYATLQFGRPDESKRWLTKFVEAKFSDEELTAAANRVGSGLLINMSRHADIQPEGKQVAEMVFAAAARRVHDPAYLDEQIKKLSAPELAVRQSALSRLDASGPAVVTPMLRVMLDNDRESEHRYLRAALARLAPSTEAPLIGALDVPNDQLKAQIIAVLGRMSSERAVMHLVRPAVDPAMPAEVREVAAASLAKIVGKVPDRYEAEKYLRQEIDRLLGGRLPFKLDEDQQAEMWDWDDTNRQMTSRKLPRGDAALYLATRLTADFVALQASSSEARRLQIMTSLELAKVLGGLDQPLNFGAIEKLLAGVTPETMNQVLADSIKAGRVPAIIASIEVLARLGDAEVLTARGPQESPLALALLHSDRRVRLTAALAIVELNPTAAFPGASRVLDTLAQAIRTTGAARVLVGHPRGVDAQSLVGFMNDLGYEGEAAYIGRHLAETAIAGTDYEFILISDAIASPPVKDLVQWLRKDYRTARIPIGVMARSEDLHELRYAFENDPFTIVFPRIHSTEVARVDVDNLLALAGRNYVDRTERTSQAQAALAAIARLGRTREAFTFWNLLRREDAVISAMDNPSLTAAAADVLAQFGTPKSQTALLDFASQNARPLADRQAAAAAFAATVKLRGLNLTQQQIAAQFERYNASAKLDAQTQNVLGSLLDAIEAPAIASGALTRSE